MVSLGLIAVLPVLVGMTSTVVVSDSMSPGIRAGDVAVVRPMAARETTVGQVVLVDDPDTAGRLRLHRIVERDGDRLVLQGDANAQRDSATIAPAAVHGVAFLRVPWIGLPILWLRSGDVLLALLAGAGVIAAAAAVAVLDPGRGPGGAVAARLRRRLGRGRGTATAVTGGAAVLLGVLVVAGATIPGTATARAAFSGTTASRPNALSVPVWPCPVLPSPGSAGGPGIAFSFNPTSGTAEPNRGVNGSAFSATAPAVDTRVGGGCAAGSTPSLRLPGSAGQAVVGGAVPASNQGTQTIWFSPTAATGVLQSVGGGTAASTDRQLYFTGDGRLGFAMRNGSAGIMTCAAPGAVALSTWHFAAVVYDTTAKTITLYLDGVQTLCPTLITTPANITAASRLGADLMLDTTAPTTPYSGSIDEAYAWGVPMTAAQVAQVRTAGH